MEIERIHVGPTQGAESNKDNIWDSLIEDVKYANRLHIDPWKAYPTYEEGLEWTVAAIAMCLLWNPAAIFEVGTTEGVRPFTVAELDKFLADLQDRLTFQQFAAIQYVVVQGECEQRMLKVVERHGKTALDVRHIA